ncbi:MAG: alpha/beta hydrolase [Pseudomonadota bacterium]
MTGLVKIAFLIAAIYLGFGMLLFAFQRVMLFPRDAAVTLAAAPVPEGALERMWINVAGQRVEAWFIPPETASGPAPIALLAHGNAETIDTMALEFLPLRQLGMALLLVEYPGYGRSGGRPSQASIGTVLKTACDLVAGRPDVDSRRWVYIGRSLGGGAVCDLAVRRPPAAMVLISTFTSVKSFARRYLMPGLLVRDPFDNLTALRTYPGPALIIHGSRDELIDYRHAQKLHAAATGSRLITYDCGHNDCPPDPARFWSDLTGFLTEAGIVNSPGI